MNQEIRPGLTNIGQSLHNEGKDPAEFAGANHGVKIFMPDDQGQESSGLTTPSITKEPAVDAVRDKAETSGEGRSLFGGIDTQEIQNLELRQYAESFGQKIQEKPLSDWPTESLKEEYFRLRGLTSRLEGEGTFGEKERVATDAQPYVLEIMRVLESRGEDLRELFLETVKKFPTRSLGAAEGEFGEEKTAIRRGRESRGKEIELTGLRLAMEDANFDEIERIIKSIDFDALQPYELLDIIGRESIRDEIKTKKSYGYAIEYVVERIIGVPDITPRADYEISFHARNNLEVLLRSVRDKDEQLFKYLSMLRHLRLVSHEVYRTIGRSRDDYKAVVTKYVGSEGFAFLENQVAGVGTTQRLYEKTLAHRVSLKKGWLSESDFEEVEGELRELLIKKKEGKTRIVEKEDGTKVMVSRGLREWEIKRALTIGRSMAAASQRRTVYGILGDIPDDPDVRLRSFDSEYIARVLGGVKAIGGRFLTATPVSKKYLERYLNNKREVAAREGRHYGGKLKDGVTTTGLYGQSEEALIYLHTGVVDPKSSGWRANIMFLKQGEANVVDPTRGKITIGEHLDQEWENAKAKVDPKWRNVDEKGREKAEREEERKAEFSLAVRSQVKAQRLFLGTIVRNEHLSDELKAEIWKNVAEYLPSRMAAFFPECRRTIVSDERWDDLRIKLYLAEEQRVMEDAELIRGGQTPSKKLGDYFEQNGINEEEVGLIKKLTDYGKEKAPDLATMIFPFTPFLDDAPKTAWEKSSQADLYRILVSDQDNFDGANTEHMAIIENPAAPLKEITEHLVKMEKLMASPMSHPTAQKFMEASVVSILEMRMMNNWAKWTSSSLMKIAHLPRSEVEKFNLEAHVADDERDLAEAITALSASGVISSDVHAKDKGGLTQIHRIKEKVRATRKDLLKRLLRLMMWLLPAEMVMEMFKTLAPDEFLKAK